MMIAVSFFERMKSSRRFLCFALSALMLLFSPLGNAGTLDLDKPISVAPGRGVALFSFTLSNELQAGTTLSWRAVRKSGEEQESGDVTLGTTGWFKNEELAKTPHRKQGALFGLDLPPGSYEFYQFRSTGQQRTVSAKEEFSRKFVVEAGKINYIGNLDLLTGENDFGGGRLLVAFIFGVFTDAFTTYPTLIDRGDLDLPLLIAKGNGLTAEAISSRVMVDAADSAMLSEVEALRARAEGGDVQAQSTLLVALARGWAILPDQRRIKIFNGREAWPALADKLSAQGVPGAATYLGMRYDAVYAKQASLAGIYEKDDPTLALQNYLIDAARYQENAIVGAKRLLKNRAGENPENARQLVMLDRRLDGLRTLTPESLPYGDGATRAALQQYGELSPPKYFALSKNGAHGTSSGDKPSMKAALEACSAGNPDPATPCQPYAMYSRKLWNACPPEMVSEKTMTAPPYAGLGEVTDAEKLPKTLDEAARQAYGNFLKLAYPRAFAVSEQGGFGVAAGDCQAAYRALLACTQAGRGNCRLWAIDDQIISGTADAAFIEAERKLLGVAVKEGAQSPVALTKGDVR